MKHGPSQFQDCHDSSLKQRKRIQSVAKALSMATEVEDNPELYEAEARLIRGEMKQTSRNWKEIFTLHMPKTAAFLEQKDAL